MALILVCIIDNSSVWAFNRFVRDSHGRSTVGRRFSQRLYDATDDCTEISQRNDLAQTGSIMTLSRFMIEATRANPDHADFESLIESTQLACKTISNQLARAGIDFDLATPENVIPVKKSMYDTASTILKNSLRFTGKIGVATSYGEDPVLIEESYNSKYVAVFDPLDGTTCLDAGIVTGTIFAIFEEEEVGVGVGPFEASCM